jgi:hypothetical protein
MKQTICSSAFKTQKTNINRALMNARANAIARNPLARACARTCCGKVKIHSTARARVLAQPSRLGHRVEAAIRLAVRCAIRPQIAKLRGFSAIQTGFAFADKPNHPEREKRVCDVECLLMSHAIENPRCIPRFNVPGTPTRRGAYYSKIILPVGGFAKTFFMRMLSVE